MTAPGDRTGESWRKSSQCDGGACVEAANAPGRVTVRDSEDPGGTVLAFTPRQWLPFLAALKDGRELAGGTG